MKRTAHENFVADLLIAYWRFCESQGLEPSIRKATAHVRAHGYRVDDKTARSILAQFTAVAPHRKSRRTAEPPRKSSTITADTTIIPESATATPPRLHAGDKVLLVPESRGEELNALPLPAAAIAPGPIERVDPRTANEREADAAIEMLRSVIECRLTAMKWTSWRRRNRRHVVDMVGAGFSAEQILAAHREQSERLGGPIIMIPQLQAALNPGPAFPHGRRVEKPPTSAYGAEYGDKARARCEALEAQSSRDLSVA